MLREVERPDGATVRFEYDALARRTRKLFVPAGGVSATHETRFIWDSHTIVHELDSHAGLVTWYWEPKTLNVVAKERRGERLTVTLDHLGAPSAFHDGEGERVWGRQHTDGLAPGGSSGDECPWLQVGQYQDAEIRETYNRYRYFDSAADGFILAFAPLGAATSATREPE